MITKKVIVTIALVAIFTTQIHGIVFAGGFGGHQTLRLSKRDYIEIPLEKRENAYFVEVTLNQVKSLFLLDTGASATVLSQSKKGKYDYIESKHVASFRGIGGEVNANACYIKDFKVGDVAIGRVKLWIVPSDYSPKMQDVDGILGEDIISKYDGFIDHGSERLFLKKK